MSRFNTNTNDKSTKRIRTAKRGAMLKTVSTVPTTTTLQGGPGFKSDSYGELFRLGVNLMAGGENTYYEGGKARDARFGKLVETMAINDPIWLFDFLFWLRRDGMVRTAPVLGAVHAAYARLENSNSTAVARHVQEIGINRKFIAEIPNRLDEVGEMFAMWRQLFPHLPFPQALKRGAGDALKRLLSQYSFLKYDTGNHDFRIADILNITHVHPDTVEQNLLFNLALQSRYGAPVEFVHNDELLELKGARRVADLWEKGVKTFDADVLDMVAASIDLRKRAEDNPRVLLEPGALRSAGMTWNAALSIVGNKIPKAEIWEALIFDHAIPYEAMLKNLRNMQEAGIGKAATDKVKAYIANPIAVSKSGQFPYRFWAAYKNATGTQWAEPIETALTLSTQNIPALDGGTLILTDTSASMTNKLSNDSTMMRLEAAAVMAVATALRNPGKVDLHVFASTHDKVNFRAGDSMLRTVDNIVRSYGSVGHGTMTAAAVRDLFNSNRHSRVMVFTDMQHGGYGVPSNMVTPETWVYHWDLAGHDKTDVPSGVGRVHHLGGLTDATMRVITMLERGQAGRWPWQN